MKSLLLLILVFLACNQNNSNLSKVPLVQNGILDLREFDFINNDLVEIKGEWEFYWKQLLEPNKLINSSPNYYLAPGVRWSGLVFGRETLKPIGFATYKVKLLFPKESIGKVFGLKFKTTGGAAYKVFLNDKELIELGKVGIDKSSMIPTRKAANVYFALEKEETDLLVQVSNFHHADGAFWYVPELGLSSQISLTSRTKQIIDASLFGSIFIMALYHLSLFLHRRKDKASFAFALFCLSVSFYVVSVNEVFIYYLCPSIPYKLAHSILLVYYLAIPLYLSFLKSLFPDDFSSKLIKLIWMVTSFCYLFTLFSNTEIGSHLERPYTFYVMICFFYALFGVVKALIRGRKDSRMVFIPNLIFVGCVINDALTIYAYIQTPILLSYAIFIFIVAQSVLLSRRFSKAFTDVEFLSHELKKHNELLEIKIEKRTLQYKQEKLNAEEANLWKDKFLMLVAHDLRAPLSSIHGIISLLETDKALTEDQKKVFLQSISNVVTESMSMVSHLLNMSRFPHGRIQVHYKDVELRSLSESVINGLDLEIRNKNLKIKNYIPEDTIITVDEQIISEVIRNIVFNAIKYSYEEGQILLGYKDDSVSQFIMIKDTGIGMPDDVLQNIFSKEISNPGTQGEKGFGIGLKLSNELIELHKGSIRIESKQGSGSTFIIQLPTNQFTIMDLSNKNTENFIQENFSNKNPLVIKFNSIQEGLKVLSSLECKAFLLSAETSHSQVELFRIAVANEYLEQETPLYFI